MLCCNGKNIEKATKPLEIIQKIHLETYEVDYITKALNDSKNSFNIKDVKILTYRKSDIIVTQNELWENFSIILDGEVQVNTISKGLIGIMKSGKWFGSKKYKFAKGTLKALDEVKIGNFKFLNVDKKIISPEKPLINIINNLNDISFSKKMLGEGNFAEVFKCKLLNEKYAIKCIKKDIVCKHGAQQQTKNELSILEHIEHPFIVKLMNILQDNYAIYLITELLTGGELFKYLTIKGKLKIDEVKFYTGNIILALEYLHNNEIIYRDLKPENIVFNNNGYLKLVDFGFAKKLSKKSRTNTILGTPDYIAPEILSEKGYNWSVDIWALGIFLYEMLIGETPYFSSNIDNLYNIITNERLDFKNIDIDIEAKNLILSLLHINSKHRIGCQEEGIKELKTHRLFTNFDWKKMENQELLPFFKPKNKKSTSEYVNYTFHTYKLNTTCNSNTWFPKITQKLRIS